jgi:hypothetical protein
MTTSFNPPLRVEVKDHGLGDAVALLDYGPKEITYFVVFLDASGDCEIVDTELVKKIIA